MTFEQIAVIGGGAWGTALALTCTRAGRSVSLWESDPANAAHLAKSIARAVFLPGVRLDDASRWSADLAEAARAEAILLVVPAQTVRAVMKALSPLLIAAGTPVIVCAKGIERGTQKVHDRVVAECAPSATPADPVRTELRCRRRARPADRGHARRCDGALAAALAQAIGSATFRPYHSTDVRGVELGGAAKNVLAIAAGVVTGRGLGASARRR